MTARSLTLTFLVAVMLVVIIGLYALAWWSVLTP